MQVSEEKWNHQNWEARHQYICPEDIKTGENEKWRKQSRVCDRVSQTLFSKIIFMYCVGSVDDGWYDLVVVTMCAGHGRGRDATASANLIFSFLWFKIMPRDELILQTQENHITSFSLISESLYTRVQWIYNWCVGDFQSSFSFCTDFNPLH